jgi:Flp pilus assembly protein TadD
MTACASTAALSASWRGARLYAAGTRALDRGDVAAAVVDLEAAATLVPQSSEVQNHLGLAYAAVGRPEDARRAFGHALELDCGNAAARHNLRVADRAR